MNWYNHDTSEMEDVAEFPVSAEKWKPYIPKHRRAEFWLRSESPFATPKEIATAILADEGKNKNPWKMLYEEMARETTPPGPKAA